MMDERLTGTVVTVTDVRKAGFCVRGLRRWLQGHGLNLAEFTRSGIPAEEIAALDDALADRVLEEKAKRLDDGR